MLPLINNLFNTLDRIIEFENIFNNKFDNHNLINAEIKNYITKNEITKENIDAKISSTRQNIENNKNNPMIQKALLSELVLLSELKKSNLDINQANIDQVDQKYKKTFLTTRFNLFLPSYIDGITKTVNSNESPSTSDSTPTVEELQKEDDSSVINSNEAPTIDKTEILKNNLAKFNLKFDFSDDEKNKIIQTIERRSRRLRRIQ